MDDARLRPAAAADAGTIAAIYNESIRAGGSTMELTPLDAAAIRARMDAFTDREGYLLLDAGGRAAGFGVVARYSTRAGYRYAAETAVYLRHDATGRGLGTRLQRALLDRCRQWGYHHLVAKIWATNTASIRLHAKLGYEIVGTQREIGYAGGRWQDVVIMQYVMPGGETP